MVVFVALAGGKLSLLVSLASISLFDAVFSGCFQSAFPLRIGKGYSGSSVMLKAVCRNGLFMDYFGA